MSTPRERDRRIDSLWGYVFRNGADETETDNLRVLSRIPLFERLSRRELRKVLGIIHHRRFAPGEHVFTCGQPGAAMFVIKKGTVEIVAPGRDGAETVLAQLTDATFLGELALLDDSPRSASARALEPTEVFALFRSDLNRFFETEHEIAGKILRQLAMVVGQRLKATNQQLSTLRQRAGTRSEDGTTDRTHA